MASRRHRYPSDFKIALATTNTRGTQLGRPNVTKAMASAAVKVRDNAAHFPAAVLPIIDSLKAERLGLGAIARELDRRGIKTRAGANGPPRPSGRSCYGGKEAVPETVRDESAMARVAIIAYNPINAD